MSETNESITISFNSCLHRIHCVDCIIHSLRPKQEMHHGRFLCVLRIRDWAQGRVMSRVWSTAAWDATRKYRKKEERRSRSSEYRAGRGPLPLDLTGRKKPGL